MTRYIVFLPVWLLLSSAVICQEQAAVLFTKTGKLQFKSDAPLEVIEAWSGEVHGAVEPEKRTFAFSVEIKSFQGFNSPLQREHFFENYMEAKKYPKATFTGKIIETMDFTQPGTYSVRAKGRLDIHGISQERIIKGELTVTRDGKIRIGSDFTVLLKDHNITIPKVVYQKIAEEIKLRIEAELAKK